MIGANDETDLCATDPGLEVDLYVTTDLRTMTEIWLGNLHVRQAMDAERLDLHGPTDMRTTFGDWLGLSPFARIEPMRAAG